MHSNFIITDEQKQAIVQKHLLSIGRSGIGEDVDEIGFAEVEVGPETPYELTNWAKNGFESGDMTDDVGDFGPGDVADQMG